MADKISTVVLKVDLECQRCYKKIRKVLCKIQDKMNIKTISFDEKSNAVTVSGPFDPEKLCRKLCSEGGKVIREMHVKGKESKDGGAGGDKPKAVKDAGKVEKDGGKAEKPKDGGGKAEKEGKADKKDAGEKPVDAKPEKKVTFEDAKPVKAMQADLGPLLEKMMQAKQGQGGPQPPKGEPMKMMPPPPAAAQGVAVPSIWPAPAGPVSCYSYDLAGYGQPSYYGGGGDGGGCGGGCQCASCYRPAPPGGYYGVPVHDHQGWYYGNRQPYYQLHQQQQPYCSEDPNAGCSVM
uniref:Uncharacterized protein n=1 Tax=Avena sativa TaxID=4498 RepID=A0ACD5WSM4_AVESA